MMADQNHIKSIAIVGATGQLGSQLVSQLIQNPQFTLSALSRSNSDSELPQGVRVFKGDYDSSEFLDTALRGQDVLIIAFGFEAPLDLETRIIDAAGKAGVPWIIPNEWSSDGSNEELCKTFTLLGEKRKFRDQIEGLDTSSWIGIANNPWFDYSLKGGWFGIDIANRKATIFDDGKNLITTTTIAQTCRGVAALLSLPITSSTSAPSLSDYKNSFVYLESFRASQFDMLASLQWVTNTLPRDWKLETKSTDDYIKEGQEEKENGGELGIVKVLYGSTFKKGLGDRFHGKETANERLGLPVESLDEVVQQVVREVDK